MRASGFSLGALEHKMLEVRDTSDQLVTEKVATSALIIFMMAIAFESLSRVSGVLPPAQRGDITRPSSLVGIGTALSHASVISGELLGASKETKSETLNPLTKKLMEAAASQTSLNTGPKVRASFMNKEPAMTYASIMMSTAAMFSGRSAVHDRPNTRAASQLKSSTSTVRALFNCLVMENKFNVIHMCKTHPLKWPYKVQCLHFRYHCRYLKFLLTKCSQVGSDLGF